MNILYITHVLNGLLMVLLGAGLGILLARRFGLSWQLWWIGAGTFILSQVGHIPFNALLNRGFKEGILPMPPDSWRLVFFAAVAGLSAGLWEEWFRYGAYRWWAKDTRTWRRGLLMGAGHGGIEAILLGSLVLYNFIVLASLKGSDLSTVVPPEQFSLAQAQMQTYWSLPWYDSLLGAVERLFSLCFHLSASILVMQAFTRRQIRWVWLAVAWHAFVDAGAVYAAQTWGVYLAEGLIGGFALASLGILFWLRQPEPELRAENLEPLPAPLDASTLAPIPENDESLEDSRYT